MRFLPLLFGAASAYCEGDFCELTASELQGHRDSGRIGLPLYPTPAPKPEPDRSRFIPQFCPMTCYRKPKLSLKVTQWTASIFHNVMGCPNRGVSKCAGGCICKPPCQAQMTKKGPKCVLPKCELRIPVCNEERNACSCAPGIMCRPDQTNTKCVHVAKECHHPKHLDVGRVTERWECDKGSITNIAFSHWYKTAKQLCCKNRCYMIWSGKFNKKKKPWQRGFGNLIYGKPCMRGYLKYRTPYNKYKCCRDPSIVFGKSNDTGGGGGGGGGAAAAATEDVAA